MSSPLSTRFSPNSHIETAAVLSLDDDASITTEEIDFAFSVWQNFKGKIGRISGSIPLLRPTEKELVLHFQVVE